MHGTPHLPPNAKQTSRVCIDRFHRDFADESLPLNSHLPLLPQIIVALAMNVFLVIGYYVYRAETRNARKQKRELAKFH